MKTFASSLDPNALTTENLGSDRIEAAAPGHPEPGNVWAWVYRRRHDLSRQRLQQAGRKCTMPSEVSALRLAWRPPSNWSAASRKIARWRVWATWNSPCRASAAMSRGFHPEGSDAAGDFPAPDVMDSLAAFARRVPGRPAARTARPVAQRFPPTTSWPSRPCSTWRTPYPLVDYLATSRPASSPNSRILRRKSIPCAALQRHYLTVLAQQMQAFDGPSDPQRHGAPPRSSTPTARCGSAGGQHRYNLGRLAGALKPPCPRPPTLSTAAHLADLHTTIAEMLGGASPENPAAGQP